MRHMPEPEWRAFLREGTRTAKLAFLTASGRPTVTPVWFVLDDDGVIRMVTGEESSKAKAIRRDPHVSLVVDEETPPYSFVRVQATAEIVSDPVEVRRIAEETGRRYMGTDRAAEFAERNGVPGEVVVELRPLRVVATSDVAG